LRRKLQESQTVRRNGQSLPGNDSSRRTRPALNQSVPFLPNRSLEVPTPSLAPSAKIRQLRQADASASVQTEQPHSSPQFCDSKPAFASNGFVPTGGTAVAEAPTTRTSTASQSSVRTATFPKVDAYGPQKSRRQIVRPGGYVPRPNARDAAVRRQQVVPEPASNPAEAEELLNSLLQRRAEKSADATEPPATSRFRMIG